ncbi:hypothetical protein FGB62_49g111 [Gracilaria domingensis]|nr:hypothetical protein FGB62_49g111 [Gracilaria domingensis]
MKRPSARNVTENTFVSLRRGAVRGVSVCGSAAAPCARAAERRGVGAGCGRRARRRCAVASRGAVEGAGRRRSDEVGGIGMARRCVREANHVQYLSETRKEHIQPYQVDMRRIPSRTAKLSRFEQG